MWDFFLSPFLALYSLKFYRRVSARPLAVGFYFLAYLSLLFSIWALILFRIHTLPLIDDFAGWLGISLPKITVTEEGLQLEKKEPVLLTHPRFGAIAYIDPTSDTPKPEDLEKAFVILTRTKVIYRNPETGEVRMQNLISARRRQHWGDAVVTGDKVVGFWNRTKPFALAIFFFIVFTGTYVWKLLAGLAYSLVGLIFNRFRKDRLSYGKVLSATFFSLAPVSVLEWFAWQFPRLHLPVNPFVSIAVTLVYLGLALLCTQEKTG